MKTLSLAFLLLVVNCSNRPASNGRDDQELMGMFEPRWFSVNENHSLRDQQSKPQPHLFFDITPEFSKDQRFANVIVTTPRNSPHAYQVDLSSGQRHYSHSYCPQKDVWNRESGTFNRPSFSIGYMPRVLDQIGQPQKVIVFGSPERKDSLDSHYYRTKIVAAYVEQICPEGNCLGKDKWLSRLVLVAMDDEDPAKNINSLEDFKRKYDWGRIRAELENIEGKNFVGSQPFPLIKINNLFGFDEAFAYFKKHALYMNDAELRKIQQGCHSLYDRLWKDVGEIRPEDRAAKTTEQLNEKLKLREDLRAKKQPVGFAERMKLFTRKYSREMATCEKFVYSGNINKDPDQFWFLAYMGIFYRLHKEGFYFDCDRKAWLKNTLDVRGELVHKLGKEIQDCSAREIDLAMTYIPNFLRSLRGSAVFYRFIDYDTHAFGTHRKMYSWVRQKTHKFDCSHDPNEVILRDIEIVPEDIRWKARDVVDIEDEMKLIY